MSEKDEAGSTSQQTFEEQVQGVQDQIEHQFRKIGKGKYARILRMARKPTKTEYKQTTIVCGVGLALLGFTGFVIMIIMNNLLPMLLSKLTGL